MRGFARLNAAIIALGGLILLLAGCGAGVPVTTPTAAPSPAAPVDSSSADPQAATPAATPTAGPSGLDGTLAPPPSYFGRYAPPFPLPIIVYRDGQALLLTPTSPGSDASYAAVVQAGTAILSDLASVQGPVALPAGVTEASPAHGVQFVYRTAGMVPSELFRTGFGPVTLDRVFLLLDPVPGAPTRIWASRAAGGWIALTSHRNHTALQAAVDAAVAALQDWGPPPTPPDQAPPDPPSATQRSVPPAPPTETPAPPAGIISATASPTAVPPSVPPATPVLVVTTDSPPAGEDAAPPTEALPSPPPLPSPPAVAGPAPAEAWRTLAAQVPYPLYGPAPDAGLVATQGPYLGTFRLEAGRAGTYAGVAAGYRVAATGETVTVVQMAGWPGDKLRLRPLLWGNGLLGFYYADATQHRLIFQRTGPAGETDIMFRTGAGISQDTLFALAAGMQPLAYPTATATPLPPAAAQSMIHDLTFADATHGWLLWSSCGPDGHCTYTIRTSTDGGRTWFRSYPAPLQAPARLRFATAQDGWLYGTGGWFTTHDGGATWTADPQQRTVILVEPVGSAVWAIERASGAPALDPLRLLVSTDAGHTWTPASSAPPLRGSATLAHTSPADAWALSAWDAAGHAPGSLWATHDGGKTWQARSNPCTDEDQARLAAGPGELWIACAGQPGTGQSIQEKTLYRSTNDGRQWARRANYDWGTPESAPDPPPGRLPMAALWDLAVPAPGQGWMIVAPGCLAHSTDAGRTWQQVSLAYDQIHAGFGLGPLVFLDADHGWVAAPSGLIRTTDGGVNWEVDVLR
jgi:photosystem II stability/assembly factor-like uncharacterized protein